MKPSKAEPSRSLVGIGNFRDTRRRLSGWLPHGSVLASFTSEDEMRIPANEKLLDEFRGPGQCEACGVWCNRREPHHIVTRGIGGNRLDLRINLIALGEAFACTCHTHHHNGHWPRTDHLLAIVAQREGMQPQQIKEAIRDIRRMPKGTPEEVWKALLPRRTI